MKEHQEIISGYLECDGIIVKVSSWNDVNNFITRFGNSVNQITEEELNKLTYNEFDSDGFPRRNVDEVDDCGVSYIFNPLTICKGSGVMNYNVKDGTIAIGGRAFDDSIRYVYNYGKLKALQMPNSVKAIGYKAFNRNKDLSNLKLSENLIMIAESAFSECESLVDLKFPNGLLYIGASAFYGCGIQSVIVPASLKKLGSHAFAECKDLKSVRFEGVPEYIGSGIFDNCSIESVVVPEEKIDFFKKSLFPIPINKIKTTN